MDFHYSEHSQHGLRPSKSLKTSEPGFQSPQILSKTDTQNTTQMSNQLKNTSLIFSRRSIWLVITSRLGKKKNTVSVAFRIVSFGRIDALEACLTISDSPDFSVSGVTPALRSPWPYSSLLVNLSYLYRY